MKVAVIGSRSIVDKNWVFEQITNYIEEELTGTSSITIISGRAKGVDQLAEAYALNYDLDFVGFEPYYRLDPKATFENRYFFIRNTQIVRESDAVLILWDGSSNGTHDVISKCKKWNKKHKIILFETKE